MFFVQLFPPNCLLVRYFVRTNYQKIYFLPQKLTLILSPWDESHRHALSCNEQQLIAASREQYSCKGSSLGVITLYLYKVLQCCIVPDRISCFTIPLCFLINISFSSEYFLLISPLHLISPVLNTSISLNSFYSKYSLCYFTSAR